MNKLNLIILLVFCFVEIHSQFVNQYFYNQFDGPCKGIPFFQQMNGSICYEKETMNCKMDQDFIMITAYTNDICSQAPVKFKEPVNECQKEGALIYNCTETPTLLENALNVLYYSSDASTCGDDNINNGNSWILNTCFKDNMGRDMDVTCNSTHGLITYYNDDKCKISSEKSTSIELGCYRGNNFGPNLGFTLATC